MNILKNKGLVITIVASILSISLTYYLFYKPKSNEILKIKKNIASLHEEVEEVERMVNRVPNPRREIEILKDRIQRLKERATNEEQIPRIMQQMFQKTGELDIEVISIVPRDDIEEISITLPEGVGKVYVEIKIRCPFRILLKYIEELNNLALLFTIEDLNIKKMDFEETENLEILLLLSTYVMA